MTVEDLSELVLLFSSSMENLASVLNTEKETKESHYEQTLLFTQIIGNLYLKTELTSTEKYEISNLMLLQMKGNSTIITDKLNTAKNCYRFLI